MSTVTDLARRVLANERLTVPGHEGRVSVSAALLDALIAMAEVGEWSDRDLRDLHRAMASLVFVWWRVRLISRLWERAATLNASAAPSSAYTR